MESSMTWGKSWGKAFGSAWGQTTAAAPAPARAGKGDLSGRHFHQSRPEAARRSRKRRDSDLLLMRPL